jgi:hypothetical protein
VGKLNNCSSDRMAYRFHAVLHPSLMRTGFIDLAAKKKKILGISWDMIL